MPDNVRDPSYLRGSVARALVGEVTENMAGIHADLNADQIVITGYFFRDASEEDLERLEDVAGEVIADFPSPFTVATKVALITEVKRNSIHWNFLRAEVPAN